MTAEAGFSVPVRVCMSGSDHHSKLYTIHQHLWRSWFMITILINAVICHFRFRFFPSKWVSCTGIFFFFTSNYFWWHKDGGINQSTTPTKIKNKTKKVIWTVSFSTEMWSYWLVLAPKLDPLVDTLFLSDKSWTSPVFVVFRLVSSNYLKPKLESSSMV